ncbi:MAG TPA: HD-GYP domain-containing protein [Thermoleophilaceae bacterium]|nr:HD-GYP domain-containing protein [Thermoleophilaceae bacterium]
MSTTVSRVAEARARRPKRMQTKERTVAGASAGLFLLATAAIAVFVPNERDVDLLLVAGLFAGYMVAARVQFEYANNYVVPEQLVFVPMLLLLPLPYLPAMVAAASVLGMLPEFIDRTWHRDRWLSCFADSWFCVGPVLVLAALAPGEAGVGLLAVYGLAFAAQLVFDFAWSTIRDVLVDGVPMRENVRCFRETALFDSLLTPLAIAVSVLAADYPVALLSLVPLVGLLHVLSRDRQERYAAGIELQGAYRGTVMLLADVVEHDDAYTADHSRSVVELAHAVAEELGFPATERDELEFAALLHDVGKIAIPKEILNKPARLSDEEFELMKMHTVEGQAMLNRVGGLMGRVGTIVRSCHERWDGNGYPDGVAGEQIPLAARIVFCCDAYNAITTDRPYRRARSQSEAFAELREGAGSQFDPRVVAALIAVIEAGEPVSTGGEEVRALLSSLGVPTPAAA